MVTTGGFRSYLSITGKTDGNFGNVSSGVLFSKVGYQRKWWNKAYLLHFPRSSVRRLNETIGLERRDNATFTLPKT